MQAAERAHNFTDFYLQMTSTISDAMCHDVDHRYDIYRPVPYARRYADDMSNSHCSPSLRSISVNEDHPCWQSPMDFFLFCSFSLTGTIFLWIAVTLLIFSRADHRTSPVLTTFHVVFYLIFYKKPPYSSDPLIGPPTMASHATVNSDARSIQISKYLNTLLSKHASSCSAIRPNYQSQPPLMGFTYIGPRLRQPN